MIKEISCCGFRGFSKKQTLKLAIPNEKRGSGLTILVGPNGGGKSTLVECFPKIASNNPSFTDGKRNRLAGDKVCIEIKYDDHTGKLETIDGGSETCWVGNNDKPKIYYVPSRRVFNPHFLKNTLDRERYMQNPENIKFRGNELELFTRRLFDIKKNPKEFNKVLSRILGKDLHWTIDESEQDRYYLKVNKANTIYHNSDGLGEGIVSLLFITDAIFNAKYDQLIVIDEPELSLHPQLQLRLLEEILNLTKTTQVVISTHSAYMISIEAAINGGEIARVFEKDNSSVIAQIDDTCRQYFKSYVEDNYNPHVLGNDARSCFFAEDGLIITEGQDDVIILPKILEQLNLKKDISLFGFGAGGAGKIPQIAHILKCLGFSRVGALFDGDKEKDFKEFKKKFDDDKYKAWIIPEKDIRDKKAVKSRSEVYGLVDGKNQLKPEYKNDEKFKKMLEEMVDFSSNSSLSS